MPYQTAPSLLIIAGAFNAAAGLMWASQRLGYGEVCQLRRYCSGQPLFHLDRIYFLGDDWIIFYFYRVGPICDNVKSLNWILEP